MARSYSSSTSRVARSDFRSMGMSVRGGATRPSSAEQDSNRSRFQMAYGLGGSETPRLDVGAFCGTTRRQRLSPLCWRATA